MIMKEITSGIAIIIVRDNNAIRSEMFRNSNKRSTINSAANAFICTITDSSVDQSQEGGGRREGENYGEGERVDGERVERESENQHENILMF